MSSRRGVESPEPACTSLHPRALEGQLTTPSKRYLAARGDGWHVLARAAAHVPATGPESALKALEARPGRTWRVPARAAKGRGARAGDRAPRFPPLSARVSLHGHGLRPALPHARAAARRGRGAGAVGGPGRCMGLRPAGAPQRAVTALHSHCWGGRRARARPAHAMAGAGEYRREVQVAVAAVRLASRLCQACFCPSCEFCAALIYKYDIHLHCITQNFCTRGITRQGNCFTCRSGITDHDLASFALVGFARMCYH